MFNFRSELNMFTATNRFRFISTVLTMRLTVTLATFTLQVLLMLNSDFFDQI